jgi:hypothetical protein
LDAPIGMVAPCHCAEMAIFNAANGRSARR